MHTLFVENKNKEIYYSSLINEKDSEISDLTEKINQLDLNVEKCEDTLVNIRKNYDKTISEYQYEIGRKNDDIKFLTESHVKEIKEVN